MRFLTFGALFRMKNPLQTMLLNTEPQQHNQLKGFVAVRCLTAIDSLRF